jgi:hypothetical protein
MPVHTTLAKSIVEILRELKLNDRQYPLRELALADLDRVVQYHAQPKPVQLMKPCSPKKNAPDWTPCVPGRLRYTANRALKRLDAGANNPGNPELVNLNQQLFPAICKVENHLGQLAGAYTSKRHSRKLAEPPVAKTPAPGEKAVVIKKPARLRLVAR